MTNEQLDKVELTLSPSERGRVQRVVSAAVKKAAPQKALIEGYRARKKALEAIDNERKQPKRDEDHEFCFSLPMLRVETHLSASFRI